LLELQIKEVKEKQVQGQVLTPCWMLPHHAILNSI